MVARGNNVKKKDKVRVVNTIIRIPVMLMPTFRRAASMAGQTVSAFAVRAMEDRSADILNKKKED